MLGMRSVPNNYWILPSKVNKASITFYFAAHASEAQGKLEGIPRPRSLEAIVGYLREALRHAPDDAIVKGEIEEKENELKILQSLQKEPKDRGPTLEKLDTL